MLYSQVKIKSKYCVPPLFFNFISDPGDGHPVLLIGGSDRIVITHLNGTSLQPLRSLSVNGTLALDFQHSQESVCWTVSTESSGQLRCAVMRNLRGITREREIRTQQSLQCTFSFCPVLLLLFWRLSLTVLERWALPSKGRRQNCIFSSEVHIRQCSLSHTSAPHYFTPSPLHTAGCL